jgi:hypothetical protein
MLRPNTILRADRAYPLEGIEEMSLLAPRLSGTRLVNLYVVSTAVGAPG